MKIILRWTFDPFLPLKKRESWEHHWFWISFIMHLLQVMLSKCRIFFDPRECAFLCASLWRTKWQKIQNLFYLCDLNFGFYEKIEIKVISVSVLNFPLKNPVSLDFCFHLINEYFNCKIFPRWINRPILFTKHKK